MRIRMHIGKRHVESSRVRRLAALLAVIALYIGRLRHRCRQFCMKHLRSGAILGAIGIIVSSTAVVYPQATECNSGVDRIVSHDGILNVEYRRPFWIRTHREGCRIETAIVYKYLDSKGIAESAAKAVADGDDGRSGLFLPHRFAASVDRVVAGSYESVWVTYTLYSAGVRDYDDTYDYYSWKNGSRISLGVYLTSLGYNESDFLAVVNERLRIDGHDEVTSLRRIPWKIHQERDGSMGVGLLVPAGHVAATIQGPVEYSFLGRERYETDQAANQLLVEAVLFAQDADSSTTFSQYHDLLRESANRLAYIVSEYPTSDIAVLVATGQNIGTFDPASVRKQWDEAQELLSLASDRSAVCEKYCRDDDRSSDSMLYDSAMAHIERGDIDRALEVAQSISVSGLKISALVESAISYRKAGNAPVATRTLKAAWEIARGIDSLDIRNFSRIAVVATDMGQRKIASGALEIIRDDFWPSCTRSGLRPVLTAMNPIDALRFIRDELESVFYESAIESVVRSLMQGSNADVAEEALAMALVLARDAESESNAVSVSNQNIARIRALVVIAEVQTQLGFVEDAHRLFEEAKTLARGIWTLDMIARSYANVGLEDDAQRTLYHALQVARTAETEWDRAQQILGIAESELASDDFRNESLDEALVVGRSLEPRSVTDAMNKSALLSRIAGALIAAKRLEDAYQVATEAVGISTVSGEFEDGDRNASEPVDFHSFWVKESVSNVAIAFAQEGRFERALEIARTVDDPYIRARSLLGIAMELRNESDVVRSKRAVLEANNESGEVSQIGEIKKLAPLFAESFAKLGDVHDSIRSTEALDGFDAASALWRVVKYLVEGGFVHGAFEVAREIEDSWSRIKISGSQVGGGCLSGAGI